MNVKTIVLEAGAHIICLQETKLQEWIPKYFRSLGLDINAAWVEALAQGRSGGILTVWGEDHFEAFS